MRQTEDKQQTTARVYMVRYYMSGIWIPQLSYMQSAGRVHCNTAFGDMVVDFPDHRILDSIDKVMPVLIEILRDAPYVDFDKSLSWIGVY